MGLGLGVGSSYGQTNSSANGWTNSSPTYSADQGGLQSTLAQVFQSLLPGAASGGLSPNVQNMATANADAINKNYQSLTDRTNRYLASRGFGQSGLVGQNALQTNIARQGDLAQNLSNASSLQLQQNNPLLTLADQFAFANPGQYDTGASSGQSSQFGLSASAGVKIP